MATTSGTVAQYYFPGRKVIDHALRRAGKIPEQTGQEEVEICQDLLFSLLSEWISAGFPLWTREFMVLGPTIGSADVATPYGTVDIFHTYWRILNPYRGDATDTNGADQAVLFGGQPNSDVTITGANPGVIVNFGSATELDTVGVLFGTTSPSVTSALQLYTSPDGITYTLAQTLPSTTFLPGAWQYFDLDPSLMSQYVKIVYPITGSWIVNQLNFGLANGQDIEIGPLNIDDYYNLPNKQFQGDQSVSAYTDRQLNAPVIKLWPTPSTIGFYNGAVSALVRRYIQDPGTMTQNLELPPRALEACISRLATRLIRTLPDSTNSDQANYFTLMAKQQRIQLLDADATKAESLFWSEERTRAPLRIFPDLSPYTR